MLLEIHFLECLDWILPAIGIVSIIGCPILVITYRTEINGLKKENETLRKKAQQYEF